MNRNRYNTNLSAKSGIVVPPGGVRGLPTTEELDEDVFLDGEVDPNLGYNKAAQYVHEQNLDVTVPAYYSPSSYGGHNASLYAASAYQDDRTPDPFEGAASCRDIFFCFWSLAAYLFDVGSDIALAYEYLVLGNIWWFALTLVFFLVPAFIMSIFSLILYMRDSKIVGDKASRTRWASRIFFVVLQLGPLLRIIDTMIFGCKSRMTSNMAKRRNWYERMLDEDTDSMLLRLFEAFMEAAPQLVLQLYIMTQIGTSEGVFLVILQVLGLISSMITLATVLVSFQKSLRLSLPEKAKLTFGGMAMQFLWRVCTISTRVLALALFASSFHFYVFVVVAVHWMIMMVWVVKQDTKYCMLSDADGTFHHSRPFEFCFRFLAAFVHIFCFFNLIEGHSRLRCVFYYALIYVENVILVVTWYVTATTNNELSWYYLPSIVVVLFVFWVGIGFQVVYYLCCHPNNLSVLHVRKRIRCCVKCSELSMTEEDVGARVEHVVHTPERRDQTPAYEAVGLMSSVCPGPHEPPAIHNMEVQRQASNASSSNSSSLPEPPVRSYRPQKSSQKQYFRPQMQSSPQGNGSPQGTIPTLSGGTPTHREDPVQTTV
ncbi:hypothetical protein CAPTEDRAFT_173571 [Capitella teleta]|uniref:XK-related protein n=1 Tax=Capitella teleta TaxID=283909 RepID=X1ZD52_CAPTE|nr:hypothetical protein CAPTEDRAFT_173571 [Capitella teleta]|eukprot:ELU04625.1 hypothetical protein CAPTEDRAFT_173571 [Capitella teleta]